MTLFTKPRLHVEPDHGEAAGRPRVPWSLPDARMEAFEWDTTASSIARLAVETFCDWALIDILDEAGVQHRVAVEHADPSKGALAAEVRQHPPNPAAHPDASERIRAGRSILSSIVTDRDIEQRARDGRQAELARSLGLASYIVSALVARGRILGTISFLRVNRKRPFGQGDLRRAEEIARQAALAIDNARLAGEARRAAERIARLQNVTAALSEAVTPQKVVDAVLDHTLLALEAEAGGLWRVVVGGAVAELLGERGMPEVMRSDFQHIPLDAPLPVADVIRSGEPVWIETQRELEARYPVLALPMRAREGERSVACLPLMAEGRCIGGLSFTFLGARRGDPGERAFLMAIARQCAQALERARLYEEERRARAEAEAAHQRVQQVVNASPLAIGLADAEGRMLMWNPAAERLYGYPKEEVLGRVLPPPPSGDVEESKSNLQRTLGGNTLQGAEMRRQRKDGGYFDAVVWTARLDSSRGPQCLSFVADISERKRLEEEQQFLAQATEVLTSSLDYEQSLRTVARLAVPFLGTLAIVDGPRFDPAAPLAVVGADAAQEEWVRELRRRYPLRGKEPIRVAIHSGQGRIYALPPPEELRRFAVDEEHARMLEGMGVRSFLVVPLKARGQTLGGFSFCASDRDYGPRDLALAEELARRTAIAIDNARLYRELQEAVRARDDFLSIAGHALRTPLTSLQLQLRGTLRMAQQAEPPARITERAEKAVRSLDRLLSLTSDLLAASRIAAGKLLLETSEMELMEVVREVVDRERDELALAGCGVEVDARGPVRGRWDRQRLDQVVTNLLSNALKYGKGRPIRIRLEADGELARLVIRDQGDGISPEDLPRLFERFARAGTPRDLGGLGLGLWIARHLVEAHGGSIRVESAPGQGATFTVELPRSGPAAGGQASGAG